MYKKSGFTLIELIVSVFIIAVLSTIILVSITQYINKGKDADVSALLSTLIPAGETFYSSHGDTYVDTVNSQDFCTSSDAIAIFKKIPIPPGRSGNVCDNEHFGSGCDEPAGGDRWMACAQKLTDPTKAFCVDSRGVKGEISFSDCKACNYLSLNFSCPN